MRILQLVIGQARRDTITKECVRGKVGVTIITEKMIESRLSQIHQVEKKTFVVVNPYSQPYLMGKTWLLALLLYCYMVFIG